MKKLALLMFAILILGCGTETPVVEEPQPVIKERTPTVTSGEHFRLDIVDPQIIVGTVNDGDADVDPERINANGFRFDFDEDLKLYKIAILHEGKPLNWIPHAIADHVTPIVTATPIFGQELQFDTEYVIKIYGQNLACRGFHLEIRFRTKPKP